MTNCNSQRVKHTLYLNKIFSYIFYFICTNIYIVYYVNKRIRDYVSICVYLNIYNNKSAVYYVYMYYKK